MLSKEDVSGRKQGDKMFALFAYAFPHTHKNFEFYLELLTELLSEDKYGQRIKFPLSSLVSATHLPPAVIKKKTRKPNLQNETNPNELYQTPTTTTTKKTTNPTDTQTTTQNTKPNKKTSLTGIF